jgi:hypothetical protein
MFIRRFGFGMDRATTTIKGGIAIDLLKERFAAVGDALLDDAQRAAFAHFGPLGPIRRDCSERELPPVSASGLGSGARQAL